ncbi:Pre-mRNA-processing factor 39 [Hordeum vulgare]|nr:Pre-mRNA-processing factor 39 [Hordeum vulgare]
MMLSVVSDCVLPLLTPSSPTKAHPGPTILKTKSYAWDGVVREWVSMPPIWLAMMPAQEQIYLKNSRQRRLTEEHLEGERLEQLEHDTEAE